MSSFEENKNLSTQLIKEEGILTLKLGQAFQKVMANSGVQILTAMADNNVDEEEIDSITNNLMEAMSKLPEYQELLQFRDKNKTSLSQMYRFFAELAEQDCEQLLRIIHYLRIESSVRETCTMLLKKNEQTPDVPGPDHR